VRTLHEDTIADDAGWIARHLTRTKLDLALGAGGAKGLAHVGVIDVLERAGYAIDFVTKLTNSRSAGPGTIPSSLASRPRGAAQPVPRKIRLPGLTAARACSALTNLEPALAAP
jgi:hypothetical protein